MTFAKRLRDAAGSRFMWMVGWLFLFGKVNVLFLSGTLAVCTPRGAAGWEGGGGRGAVARLHAIGRETSIPARFRLARRGAFRFFSTSVLGLGLYG